ncbi:hypothetical protein Tco_1113546 [Tanacetum coccineum]|uniref:Uncharacterized protein n=1 Tax=Tanacetum coccineum TaxID=301880 RepID=A0ABQ5IV75_9ASTR
MTTAGTRAVVNTGKGKMDTDLKKSRWVWRPKGNYLDHVSKDSGSFMLKKGNPEILLQDHAVVDSGCSSHMTGNKAYLSDYEDYNGGFVAFGSDPKGDELKLDIMFAACACARLQVTPKASHLNAVKRIFRSQVLEGNSTQGGCQFLGRRLIFWQCKKQTIVVNSTTEAEYVAAANYYGQVLQIQNQMMDYGFNFMNTKIHIDNESTISVIKNLVAHSRGQRKDTSGRLQVNSGRLQVNSSRHKLILLCHINTGTSLRYALSHNPTIYDSLVKQFWQTATVRTLANRTQELVASIDNKEYTITEAFVRSKLQLADAACISNLPDADIYDGLATLGYVSEGVLRIKGEGSAIPAEPQHTPVDPVPSTSQPPTPSTNEPLQQPSPPRQSDRQDTEIPQSQGPTFTHVVDKATTTEDSLKLKELSLSCTKLELKIGSLEKELKETKQTFGNVILTLVVEPTEENHDIVKILSSLVRDFVTPTKTKVSASGEVQEEDISPTTLEAAKTLSKVASQKARSTDKGRRYKRRKMSKGKDIITGLDVKVEITTWRETVNITIPSPVKGQREGKAPMTTKDVQVTKRTKAQIQQDTKAGLAEAMRLQSSNGYEEVAKLVQFHEAAQYYTKEDWDNIRAKLEANAELVKDVLGKDMSSEDYAKRMVDMINQKKKYYVEQKAKLKQETSKKQKIAIEDVLEEKGDEPMKEDDEAEEDMEAIEKGDSSSGTDILVNPVLVDIKPPSIANWKIINLGKKGVYQIVRENGTDKIYISFGAMLKDISRDDLTELYRLVMRRYGTNGPEDEYERVFWRDLKTMFDPPLSTDLDWNLPGQQKMLSWRYYDTCIVHCLNLESAHIYMLTERRYPLPADVCQAMLDKKLQGDKRDEACLPIVLKIIKKFGNLEIHIWELEGVRVLFSQHHYTWSSVHHVLTDIKNLAKSKQMALVKLSKLLMG